MSLETLFAVAGVALILFVLVDVLMTVFVIGGGAGPQSAFVADRMWRLALRLHNAASTRSHSLMRTAGPLMILLVLVCWVTELVLGWALIFPVEAFEEPASLGLADRILFAAAAIIGRGGNSPALAVDGDRWELYQTLAGLSGVFIISVGLAYVLPILAAVAHKRSIASRIHTLGDSVEDMRALGRTAGGSSFELHLVALTAELSLSAERHRAYPVLHYFHSRDRHAALAPAVAKVALFLQGDLDGVDKVDRTVRVPLERAIANLVAALSDMGLSRYARDTSCIDESSMSKIALDPKTEGGAHEGPIPAAWLEAYVRFDGWDWSEVAPEAYQGDGSREKVLAPRSDGGDDR